jgi:hypothetical protein
MREALRRVTVEPVDERRSVMECRHRGAKAQVWHHPVALVYIVGVWPVA